MLVDGLGDIIPEIGRMSRDFALVPTDVPWMNEEHPEVRAAERKLKETVKNTVRPEVVISRLEVYCALLEATLNSRIRCVGSCVWGQDGRLVFDLRGGQYGELWGCFVSAAGMTPHFSVVSRDGKGILSGNADTCRFAMPLFAPAPSYSVFDVLESLKKNTGQLQGIRFPYAWPRNVK